MLSNSNPRVGSLRRVDISCVWVWQRKRSSTLGDPRLIVEDSGGCWDRHRGSLSSSTTSLTCPDFSPASSRPCFRCFGRSNSSGSWTGGAGRAPAVAPSRSTSCCLGTLLLEYTEDRVYYQQSQINCSTWLRICFQFHENMFQNDNFCLL